MDIMSPDYIGGTNFDMDDYVNMFGQYGLGVLLLCPPSMAEVLASDDEVPAAQTASEQSLSERFCGSTKTRGGEADGAEEAMIHVG